MFVFHIQTKEEAFYFLSFAELDNGSNLTELRWLSVSALCTIKHASISSIYLKDQLLSPLMTLHLCSQHRLWLESALPRFTSVKSCSSLECQGLTNFNQPSKMMSIKIASRNLEQGAELGYEASGRGKSLHLWSRSWAGERSWNVVSVNSF